MSDKHINPHALWIDLFLRSDTHFTSNITLGVISNLVMVD